MYRKRMTMALPNLYYLDERPVFEAERLCADAFLRGGKEEEERVRKEWAANKKRQEKENIDRGAKIDEESREQRKSKFKQMMSDLKESKSSELLMEHRRIKEQWKNEPESQIKMHYFMKMRKLEDLLKQDWYVKLNKEGKDITPQMGKPSFVGKKKFIEEVDKKMKSRQEVLAEIARDRIKMKGENEQESEKVEMIISDSDDQH